jgi:hypothetical protein
MRDPRSHLIRFLVVVAVMPAAKSGLGVDGGVIFQILAVEKLGLSPAAIGSALGLGVVSLPLQMWAAGLSLSVAPRNLRLFLAFVATGCWALAAILAIADPGDTVAGAALVVTVLAEIALSVLFATSNQPLMSRLLGTRSRQQVNARGRALGGGALVAVVLVFGAVGTSGRIAILALLGVAAWMALLLLRGLSAPVAATTPTPASPASTKAAPRRDGPSLGACGAGRC